jgi:TPR repeat protein
MQFGYAYRIIRTETKHARLIAMLRAPAGATIAAMMTETEWQPHSVRGFLAGAAMGAPEAMVNLARCNANGIGGRKDLPEARRLLAKAAQAGSADAKRILAHIEDTKPK